MAFKTDSSDEAMSEINVTPLVDVMLALLAVFIVSCRRPNPDPTRRR
jgi:biopolymer transport protein ExbD